MCIVKYLYAARRIAARHAVNHFLRHYLPVVAVTAVCIALMVRTGLIPVIARLYKLREKPSRHKVIDVRPLIVSCNRKAEQVAHNLCLAAVAADRPLPVGRVANLHLHSDFFTFVDDCLPLPRLKQVIAPIVHLRAQKNRMAHLARNILLVLVKCHRGHEIQYGVFRL